MHVDGRIGDLLATWAYLELHLGSVDILSAGGAGVMPALATLSLALVGHVYLYLAECHGHPCDPHDVLLCDRSDVLHSVAGSKRSSRAS